MTGLSLLATLVSSSMIAAPAPNIVFFLTDDQDQLLGASFPPTAANGVTPMPNVKTLMVDAGVTATKFYIHTPICCPSRAETLTGRYLHNVKRPVEQQQCAANYSGSTTDGDRCCMHVDEGKVNNVTFAPALKAAGYTLGMFGKYLNECPANPALGWEDAWLANGGGNYNNPEFAVKNIDGLPDSHKLNSFPLGSNYTTSVVGNYSLNWIKKVAGKGKPFFAYIAPKAAHAPFIPAPWYADYWGYGWPQTAPRPPSWNMTKAELAGHHPNVASQAVLTDAVADCIDKAFKNRWRTLMSVDDVVRDTYALTKSLGVHDNTFYIYSSDHGYQLGELNLPQDKRNVYEFDIKIHMVMSGPGIIPGSRWNGAATNVDLHPTFLALAGLDATHVDGMSLVSQVAPTHSVDVDGSEVAPALAAPGSGAWREGIFVHHQRVGAGSYCGPGHFIDQMDNNFIAVRHFPGSQYGNLLYAEFQWANGTNYGMGNVDFQSPFFFEIFDMDQDPWQMNNIYETMNASKPVMVASLHDEVQAWLKCKGASCKPH